MPRPTRCVRRCTTRIPARVPRRRARSGCGEGASETERDRDAWQSLVVVLGRLATVEACAALASVALTRRSLVRRQGYSTTQRLAAVEALGLTSAPTACGTLQRAHKSPQFLRIRSTIQSVMA